MSKLIKPRTKSQQAAIDRSRTLMRKAEIYATYDPSQWNSVSVNDLADSTGRDTYLLDRDLQKQVFLDNGYIEGTPGDYGLVKKAASSHGDIPVYQTSPDQAQRQHLVPIGNIKNRYFGPDNTALEDPESFPTALYIDGRTGKPYQKAWDLNDYGGKGGSTSGIAGSILDFIGSPTVVTTGYQPIDIYDEWTAETYYPALNSYKNELRKKGYGIYDNYDGTFNVGTFKPAIVKSQRK